MTARAVPIWSSDNPDAAIPTRVRLRIFERAAGRCQICNRKLGPADKWQADHVLALVNGGAHSEANLQVACDWCHTSKTAEDVAFKAKVARIRAKHLGIRSPSRLQSRGFAKAPPQHTATSPLRKHQQ